jgi:hypothetical protein
MERQDLIFFIGAIAIVLILALVVKPLINGDPIISLPEESNDTIAVPQQIPVPQGAMDNPYSPSLSVKPTAAATPEWDGLTPKEVQFVDPSTYNMQWESQLKDFGFNVPADEEINETYVTYAEINGQWDATTQIFNIPYPHWIMDVTIEGFGSVGGEGAEAGQQFYLTPSINIQVMNADKPNGVEYILNTMTEAPVPEEVLLEGVDESGATIARGELEGFIWRHEFYEGFGNYYFIIHPNMLQSYKVEIKIPSGYV